MVGPCGGAEQTRARVAGMGATGDEVGASHGIWKRPPLSVHFRQSTQGMAPTVKTGELFSLWSTFHFQIIFTYLFSLLNYFHYIAKSINYFHLIRH